MVSMEALAMSGSDYQEFGLSIEEWELQDSIVPPHLLIDDFEEEEEDKKVCKGEDNHHEGDNDDRVFDGLVVKEVVTICDIRALIENFMEKSISYVIFHLKQLMFLRFLLENILFNHVFEFLF
ncbi:unnamed protein product [Cochlearia groenlandica]